MLGNKEGMVINRINGSIKQSVYKDFLIFTDKDGMQIIINKEDVVLLNAHIMNENSKSHFAKPSDDFFI